MDQGQCHIHGTLHLSELLVGQKASLGGLDSIDAWVVVGSILAVADLAVADSSPAAEVDLAVAGSMLVVAGRVVEIDPVVADSSLAAVAVQVAEVAEVGVEPFDPVAYELAPQDEAVMPPFLQQVTT